MILDIVLKYVYNNLISLKELTIEIQWLILTDMIESLILKNASLQFRMFVSFCVLCWGFFHSVKECYYLTTCLKSTRSTISSLSLKFR